MGGLNHTVWRQTGAPFTVKDIEYCIDGNLVEMFLEIGEDTKSMIVQEVNEVMKKQYTVKGMTNYIQDIRTKHYSVCYNKQITGSIQRNQLTPDLNEEVLSYLSPYDDYILFSINLPCPSNLQGPLSIPKYSHTVLMIVMESTPSP